MKKHVHAAPEDAVLLPADDHVGGGADTQEGPATDVEHVGDGQGRDEVGAPRIRAPVQQQIGQRPVVGRHAHGLGVLRRRDDVPQGLNDRPEHHRPGHPGTEDHGDPRGQLEFRLFVRVAEFDVPVAAAREIDAQGDETYGDPQVEGAEVGRKGLVDGGNDLFRGLGVQQRGDADQHDDQHGGHENAPLRPEVRARSRNPFNRGRLRRADLVRLAFLRLAHRCLLGPHTIRDLLVCVPGCQHCAKRNFSCPRKRLAACGKSEPPETT